MTVVAFSSARFTPADVGEWNAIALPKLQRGLWASVARQTSPEGDKLVVRFPNLDRPVFSFERDKRGLYRLFFNDRRGWYCIGTGESAGECLAVWKGKVPRAKAAEASA